MSSITMDEVKEKKAELESKVRNTIAVFEEETGVTVDIMFSYDFGDGHTEE